MTFRDYLKVEDIEDFLKISERCDLILRMDPFLIANFYGTIFYINLTDIDESQFRRVLSGLRAKIINIKETKSYRSLNDFYSKETQV